ncbi:unnamed protein product, partial [Meganyctiphanes norvegica]
MCIMLCEALFIFNIFSGLSQGQIQRPLKNSLKPQNFIIPWNTDKFGNKISKDYFVLSDSDYRYQDLKINSEKKILDNHSMKTNIERNTHDSEHLKRKLKSKRQDKSKRLKVKRKKKKNKVEYKKNKRNNYIKKNRNKKYVNSQITKSNKGRLKHTNRKYKDKQKKKKKKKKKGKYLKLYKKGKSRKNMKNKKHSLKDKVEEKKRRKNKKSKQKKNQNQNYKLDLQYNGRNLTKYVDIQTRMITQQCSSPRTDKCSELEGDCMDVAVCVKNLGGIYYDCCDERTTCICCTKDGCVGKENSGCLGEGGICRSKCFENETMALTGPDGCGTGDGCRCCKSKCLDGCSGNGQCSGDGTCKCNDGCEETHCQTC